MDECIVIILKDIVFIGKKKYDKVCIYCYILF